MDAFIVSAVVPFASVLIGAGVTYWLNVRSRRRSYVEDIFNHAISAVAVADASRHFLAQVARPKHMTEEAYGELLAWIARTTIENHLQRCADAREALARVLPFEPEIRSLYQDAQAITDHPTEVLEVLTAARERRFGSSTA